jgi:hypothetical protein
MAFKDNDQILETFNDQTRLPSTCNHGWPGKRDDVAERADGERVYVPTPETPDDPFSK